MNEPLHPLRLGEILDRTAQIYRSRFLVFLGIATIPAGTMFVFFAGLFGLIAWIGPSASNGPTAANVIVWAFVIVLSILVVPASLGSSALGRGGHVRCGRAILSWAPDYDSERLQDRLDPRVALRWALHSAGTGDLWRYRRSSSLSALVAMVAVKVSGYLRRSSKPAVWRAVFLLYCWPLGAFAVWMLLRLCLAFPGCQWWNRRARWMR